MDRLRTRRNVLRFLAAIPLLTAGSGTAIAARTALIGRMIQEAASLANVSQRIDFISRSLLDIPYRANTLIGGPKHRERFVVRDDAFDCVTFCEVVLAAAIARDLEEFETSLRRIRYDHGKVQYDRRNHYFADWIKRNIDNRIGQPVLMEPTVVIDKYVSWHREFGRRPVSIRAVAKSTLMSNAKLLAPGDIVGFTSQQSNLDFFHTGIVAFATSGDLLLRHASRNRGRVVEEKMAAFIAANPVKYVALLRAVERDPAQQPHEA
jgi:Protein of unknown function (DUF1460)